MAGDADPVEPRANPNFFGHEEAEAGLVDACRSGRLHHSLLISGPKGVGKATLAYRLARFLLRRSPPDLPGEKGADRLDVSTDDPAFRQIAAGAHPSLRVVERQRSGDTGRLQRDIGVEAIRALSDFYRLTSADGSWRIAIVDGAEEMTQNAANALLKILEEPPGRSLILLISHAPGRLLPTIRSRCYFVPLTSLPDPVLTEALAASGVRIDDADLADLLELAEGSLGAALAVVRIGGIELYREVRDLMAQQATRQFSVELDKFSDRLARVGQEETFDIFARMLERAVSRQVVEMARTVPARGGELDRWLEVWEKVRALFVQVNGLSLDRKHVIQNAFLHVSEAVRPRASG